MVDVNLPAGLSVDEDHGVLSIRYKGPAFPGYMLILMMAGVILPIGYRVLFARVDGDLSFALVFGPFLFFGLFMGIRMVVNTRTVSADGTQIAVKVRPLPLRPVRRLFVADLQSLEVKMEKSSSKSGTRIYYSLVARHRDESSTRLLHVQGLDFKEPTHYLKEKLEKKCRL